MFLLGPAESSVGRLSSNPRAAARAPSRRGGLKAALTAFVAVSLLGSMSGAAHASLSSVGPIDATTNFPVYYQDSKGVRLEPCLDGPPLCSAAAADLVAPDGEAFYSDVSATMTTRNRGKAGLVLALEAAYAGSGSGQEIVFGRVRFFATAGLDPGARYTVTHPYGVDTFIANASGAVPKNAGTEDLGALGPCVGTTAHAAGGVCDFRGALAGRVGPFLRWDPAVAPAAPDGYLGDAATPHPITGSPTGNNRFRIQGPNINPTPTVDGCPSVAGPLADCLETNLFTVEGKIAGPLMTTPSSLAFGSRQVGAGPSTVQNVTVKNIGAGTLTLSDVSLDGATGNPEDFRIQSTGTCVAGTTLLRNGTCTVKVQFSPTLTSALGTRTASVLIGYNGLRSPKRIPLRGSAAAKNTKPKATMSATPLDFGTLRLSAQSPAQTVTVTNAGTADMNISKVAITGADAGDFGSQNTCVGVAVPPGGTCSVDVVFAPQLLAGSKSATLTVKDDFNVSHAVALSGIATAGLTAFGAPDPTTNFPSSYTDTKGLSLQLCLDGPPNCSAAPSALVAPDGEAFYNSATATLGTRNGGKATMVLALEAAYAGAGTGQEIVFSRIRFSDSGGLLPKTQYTVTHPFGVDTFTTDAAGAVPKNAGTQDIGSLGSCSTATAHDPGGVCDFAGAMRGRFGPFLGWDPKVAPAAPSGYVGDAATPHKITGSPTGDNLVRIEGPGVNPSPTADACPTVDGLLADCVETDLFTVEGKLAP